MNPDWGHSSNGYVFVDKPEGMSSNLVVGRLKKKLSIKKIGHTGTLDRFASGLMLLLVGKATSLSDFFLHSEKTYRAEFFFGSSTDTHDPHGQILDEREPGISQKFLADHHSRILELIHGWTSLGEQTPPLYSALKNQGQRFSDLARSGITSLPKPRQIRIYSCDVEHFDIENTRIVVDMHVSGGTYIRSFARDLGEALNFPVHLAALRRTALGHFNMENVETWKPVFYSSDSPQNPEEEPGTIALQHDIVKLMPDWPVICLEDQRIQNELVYGKKFEFGGLGDIKPGDCFFMVDQQNRVLAWSQKTADLYNYKRIFVDKNSWV